MFGIPYLDPLAGTWLATHSRVLMNSGLVVAGMMTKVGWGYWIESKREVTDAALDCQVSKDLKKQIEAEIQKIPDIISYHNLWLRKAGKRSHIKKSHSV